MKRWQSLRPAAGIFTFALLVRIGYNITVARRYTPLHDALVYHNIAINLLAEHCYCASPHIQTLDRAPLWPAILMIIYGLFGPHNLLARLFLCLVGSGTCTLVYLFARDLFHKRIGVIAGVAAALYPQLYIYDGWLYTESLFIFLLLAFCYVLYCLQTTRRLRWSFLGGVLLGLLSLTRPNGLLVIGALLVWVIVMGTSKTLPWRTAMTAAATITLISLALVAPWTIRNYVVSHTFIAVASGDGTVLFGAYNDAILKNTDYGGSWLRPSESSPTVAQRYSQSQGCDVSCQVTREADYEDHALHWIQGHLSAMPWLMGKHFLYMWKPNTSEADLPTDRFTTGLSTQLVVLIMKTIPLFVFALAALGLLLTWKRWRGLFFVYLMILLTIAQNLAFYGSPRFRAPIEPMLILLAAGVIWWLVEHVPWIRERWYPAGDHTPGFPQETTAPLPSGQLVPTSEREHESRPF